MKMARFALCALLGLGSAVAASAPAEKSIARGRARHVVLVVWDGMRPDFVTEKNAPTLWLLAQQGVAFAHHHSIYPTLTSVNVGALATGVFPNRSGPIGNYEYRPEIEPTKNARMDDAKTMWRGDELSDGKFLAVPTIAELLHMRGGRTAIAGTKSAPLLFDRRTSARSENCVTIFEGMTLPESARAEIEKLVGPYPTKKNLPSTAQDKWTTRALTEALWKDGVPEFSVLWMGDPDRSEHATGPGSPTALAAIKSADDNLAVVLRTLEAKGVREKTDVLVVSDHGFSTIERPIDLAALLAQDGFSIANIGDPAKATIRVVGNGGTVFFYVADHDEKTSARLVRWLQETDFAGVIFSRGQIEGTFPLARVHLEKTTGPDVAMSFRWNDRQNEHGIAGMIAANGKGEAKGTHGTLSAFDVHNILIAAGPDFRERWQSDLPSSNLDVAASIVHLLGLSPAQSLDGRVLTEAFPDGATPAASEAELEEATTGKWRQYLRTRKVGATIYIDEGNGGAALD